MYVGNQEGAVEDRRGLLGRIFVERRQDNGRHMCMKPYNCDRSIENTIDMKKWWKYVSIISKSNSNNHSNSNNNNDNNNDIVIIIIISMII